MNSSEEQESKEAFEVSHWVMMGCWLLVIFWLGNKPVHLDEANFLAMTKETFGRHIRFR